MNKKKKFEIKRKRWKIWKQKDQNYTSSGERNINNIDFLNEWAKKSNELHVTMMPLTGHYLVSSLNIFIVSLTMDITEINISNKP